MAVADLAPGQHATEVNDHWWWRPGWRIGRRFYAFHLTFEGQSAVHELAAAYRAALWNMPTLTLVPDRWLHLTMQGVGFTDEVPPATIDGITSRAGALLAELPPLDLGLCDVVVAHEAIALPVVPSEPVQRVRATVREAIGRVLGEDQVPDDPNRYRPHVSVAYINTKGSAKPYLTAVDEADAQPVHARIDHVSLIEMHRDRKMYEWRTLTSLPLLNK